MADRMTAEQLIAAAMTCTVCGKEHQPRKTDNYTTWAAEDGHSYRTRIFAMTGDSHGRAIEALRVIAAAGT